jgi:hypothetical protein
MERTDGGGNDASSGAGSAGVAAGDAGVDGASGGGVAGDGGVLLGAIPKWGLGSRPRASSSSTSDSSSGTGEGWTGAAAGEGTEEAGGAGRAEGVGTEGPACGPAGGTEADPCHVSLLREEALVVAAAMDDFVNRHQRYLQVQVRTLKEGDDSWAGTAEVCAVAHRAWLKIANAAEGPASWSWCRKHGVEAGQVWACPKCLEELQGG